MRVLLLTLLVALLVPTVASATMVFESGNFKRSVWVAEDDGAHPRKLVRGNSPHIAPDGTAVVYIADIAQDDTKLMEIPVTGGTPKTLLHRWQYGTFDWSDDGRWIVATAGRFNRPAKLVLIDRQTGTNRTVARGWFDGASFAPDSTALVYARRASDVQLFPEINLFTVPVAGGEPTQITTDGKSQYPLWGPERIVYSRYHKPTGKHAKDDGPKANLFLVDPDGTNRTQLTHDKVPYLLYGLTATAWSQDGKRLLAQFGGQDTSYAVTVNPATGKERLPVRRRRGFVGTALSEDGRTILGYTNGFDPVPDLTQVATAPYGGGRLRVLVAKSAYPDWTG